MKPTEFNLTPSKPSISFRDDNLALVIYQEFLQVDPCDNQFIAGLKSWELELYVIYNDNDERLQIEKTPMSFDFSIHDRHFCGMGVMVSDEFVTYCPLCKYSTHLYRIVGTNYLYEVDNETN